MYATSFSIHVPMRGPTYATSFSIHVPMRGPTYATSFSIHVPLSQSLSCHAVRVPTLKGRWISVITEHDHQSTYRCHYINIHHNPTGSLIGCAVSQPCRSASANVAGATRNNTDDDIGFGSLDSRTTTTTTKRLFCFRIQGVAIYMIRLSSQLQATKCICMHIARMKGQCHTKAELHMVQD